MCSHTFPSLCQNESLPGDQRLGVDLNINPTWFARADVRYMQGKPDVKLDGVKVGEAELNPVTIGIGLGARF